MSPVPDNVLLERWQTHRDALAFRELCNRYAGLVFSAANRVLRNATEAEDVAQDCFVRLATHSRQPKESVAAWLHTVAVRRAIDAARSESRRRNRENIYGIDAPADETPAIDDLLEHVDEAIAALSTEMRACIVGHFLRGLDQRDLARELGVSRWTVQRRITQGIERIRGELSRKGILTGAGALLAVLEGMDASAVPASLSAALGKVAVGGLNTSGSPLVAIVAHTFGGAILVKKYVLAGIAVLALGLSFWWVARSGEPESTAVLNTLPALDTAATEAAAAVAPPPSLRRASSFGEPPPKDLAGGIAPAVSQSPGTAAAAPTPIEDPADYATVAGLVVDEQGRGIPGAAVSLLVVTADGLLPPAGDALRLTAWRVAQNRSGESEGFRYHALSDSTGAFTIPGIRHAGDASAYVAAEGFHPGLGTCSVHAGDTAAVKITLREGVQLLGAIVAPSGAPIAQARVNVMGVFEENTTYGATLQPGTAHATTDGAGNFSLWLLTEGGDAHAGLHVVSDTHGAALFNMVPLGREERIKLTLASEYGSLTGRILTADGEAAPQHELYLEVALESRAVDEQGRTTGATSGVVDVLRATSGAEGRYLIENVLSSATIKATIFTPERRVAAKQAVAPPGAGETKTCDFTLQRGIRVTGTVAGSTSEKGIAGVYVRYAMKEETDAQGNISGSVSTAADGAFEIDLVSGAGSYSFHPAAFLDGLTMDASEITTTLDLAPGDTESLELYLPDPWSRSFLVVTADGAPFQGIRPGMSQRIERGTSGTYYDRATDADGMLLCDRLTPGSTTYFNFTAPGYLPERSEEVTGASGEAYPTETIVLYPAATAAIRVFDDAGTPVANAAFTCGLEYGEGRSAEVQGASDANGWLLLEDKVPAANVTLTVRLNGGTWTFPAMPNVTLQPGRINELGELRAE
ncbi:MAG: sigma-70 family RNA polymerase sigma factor [Candidatus Hydrogenedentes bacterium]|nr:sigma-70 family RNA polymerase sigma factor [Candidatus Hydrogenedentota bacterium]